MSDICIKVICTENCSLCSMIKKDFCYLKKICLTFRSWEYTYILKMYQSKQDLNYMILKGISQSSLTKSHVYYLEQEITNSKDHLCSSNPEI